MMSIICWMCMDRRRASSSSSGALPQPFAFYYLALLIVHLLPLVVQTSKPNNTNRTKSAAVCQLPLAVGQCTHTFTRFHWDESVGQCVKFNYTGCGGNGNRFRTRLQCKSRCSAKFKEKQQWKEARRLKITAKLSSRLSSKEQKQLLECLPGKNCHNGKCIHGKCQCQKGYELALMATGNGSECIDTNECHWAKCAENAQCVNLPGSFRCECRPGFAGSIFNCTKERRICSQWFDRRYEQQCQQHRDHRMAEQWLPRWYFHLHSGQCRQFWYGGCQFGDSQNFFQDKQSCESVCGGYSHQEFFADQMAQQISTDILSTTEPIKQQPINDAKDSSACLDTFDQSLRLPCADGIWKRRYYYDRDIGRCRVFWMDASCPRKIIDNWTKKPLKASSSAKADSRNFFMRLTNCQHICEGGGMKDVDQWNEFTMHLNGSSSSSVGVIQASFKRLPSDTVEKDCPHDIVAMGGIKLMNGQKERKMTKWKDAKKQKGRGKGMAKVCLDKFDWNLTGTCGKHGWQVRFFYDARMGKCRPFWNDGCTGRTRNQFDSEQSCQMRCEPTTIAPDALLLLTKKKKKEKEKNNNNNTGGTKQEQNADGTKRKMGDDVCADGFDENYRRACNNGRGWRRKWFFDQRSGFCRYFWYDGCKGRSRNMFDGLKECMDLCMYEQHAANSGDKPANLVEQSANALRYFESAEAEKAPKFSTITTTTTIRPVHNKSYVQSEQLRLNERECTVFRYNASGDGKARLSAFLCLVEEGGGCQSTVLSVENDGGAERCHLERPWLKGKHTYAWFFTLERQTVLANIPELIAIGTDNNKLIVEHTEGMNGGQGEETQEEQKPTIPSSFSSNVFFSATSSGILTLRQRAMNTTNSALVPIQPFGQVNGTAVWIDLLEPMMEKDCQQIC